MHAEIFKFLEHHAGLTPDDWRALAPLVVERKIAQGSVFIRAGETPSDLGFVLSGLVRVFYSDARGKEYVKVFLTEGKILAAYSSLLSGEPVPYSMEALEPSRIAFINYRALEQLISENAAWERVFRKLAETVLVEREKREAQLLMRSAAERYEDFVNDFPTLHGRIPQYLVASYLGITPVALSRFRRKKSRRS